MTSLISSQPPPLWELFTNSECRNPLSHMVGFLKSNEQSKLEQVCKVARTALSADSIKKQQIDKALREELAKLSTVPHNLFKLGREHLLNFLQEGKYSGPPHLVEKDPTALAKQLEDLLSDSSGMFVVSPTSIQEVIRKIMELGLVKRDTLISQLEAFLSLIHQTYCQVNGGYAIAREAPDQLFDDPKMIVKMLRKLSRYLAPEVKLHLLYHTIIKRNTPELKQKLDAILSSLV